MTSIIFSTQIYRTKFTVFEYNSVVFDKNFKNKIVYNVLLAKKGGKICLVLSQCFVALINYYRYNNDK